MVTCFFRNSPTEGVRDPSIHSVVELFQVSGVFLFVDVSGGIGGDEEPVEKMGKSLVVVITGDLKKIIFDEENHFINIIYRIKFP